MTGWEAWCLHCGRPIKHEAGGWVHQDNASAYCSTRQAQTGGRPTNELETEIRTALTDAGLAPLSGDWNRVVESDLGHLARLIAPIVHRRETQARASQDELDLAMHHAYRPEVVAEVAVELTEDADWERIAAWCGGTVDSGPDGTDSGEWTSWLTIPDVGVAARNQWITQRHDLTFAIRDIVAAPSQRLPITPTEDEHL